MAMFYYKKPNTKKITHYIERLRARDSTLTELELNAEFFEDDHLTTLMFWLIAYPNNVQHIFLQGNHLTDETGLQLAVFLSRSVAIINMRLFRNRFGKETHMAIAEALKINKSLQYLIMYDNMEEIDADIHMAFVDALVVNPDRPAGTQWAIIGTKNYQEWLQDAKLCGHLPKDERLAFLRNQVTAPPQLEHETENADA